MREADWYRERVPTPRRRWLDSLRVLALLAVLLGERVFVVDHLAHDRHWKGGLCAPAAPREDGASSTRDERSSRHEPRDEHHHEHHPRSGDGDDHGPHAAADHALVKRPVPPDAHAEACLTAPSAPLARVSGASRLDREGAHAAPPPASSASPPPARAPPAFPSAT